MGQKLNELAAAEIAALEAEGIKLTASEIVELHALGESVQTPEVRIHLSRGCPVFVGGVTLWPLTIRAEDWYRREGLKLEGAMSDIALAYAMANAYDESGELDQSGPAVLSSLKQWRSKLRCRLSQLQEAMAQILEQEHVEPIPQGPDDRPLTAAEFCLVLSNLSKTPPDFWERRCSIGYSRAMMTTILMQNRADDKPSINDPSIRSEVVLGNRVDEIRKSRANG